MEDPNIEVIDMVTPNDSHAENAIAAAKAGKHITSEKPLARTAEEAKTMLEAVEAAGVKHMVAFNYLNAHFHRRKYSKLVAEQVGPIS